MSDASIAVTCEQLALLLRSDLPLPGCIREMSADAPTKLRAALATMADDTTAGKKLSDAMRAHPDVFGDEQVAMVMAGEETDSLPDMLAEIAELALMRRQAADRLREIAAYPLLVSFAAICVYVGMQHYVTPAMYDSAAGLDVDLTAGSMGFFWGVSRWIGADWPVPAVALGLVGLFGLWMLTTNGRAIRLVTTFFNVVPGGRRVVLYLDFSRSCRYLQVLLGKGMPMPEALRAASGVAFDDRWNQRLRDWSARHREGVSLAEIMEQLPPPDPLVALAFAGPAADKPDVVFAELASLYGRRAEIAASRFAAFWTAVTSVLMFVLVGTAVLSLFMPMIRLLEQLGG